MPARLQIAVAMWIIIRPSSEPPNYPMSADNVPYDEIHDES